MRAALLALVPACAFGDGEPMGAVTVEVAARWVEDPDRDDGGWQRLASDFEVQVTAAAAELGALALIDVGGAAAGFDPANPPPGYTLCHNGHCHAEDGSLVPYEDIAAELAGGAAPAPVLAIELGAWDLLADQARRFGPEDVGRATIGRVEIDLAALAVEGVVRDRRDPPRLEGEVPFTLAVAPPEPFVVLGRIDLPVDRAHDPRIALDVDLTLTAALLDAVPFTTPEDPATAQAIADVIAETTLTVSAERN